MRREAGRCVVRNRVSFILSFLLTLYMADVAISHQEMGNSRLGLLGELGYVVTGIDSAVIQPEVRVGDIITFTNVTGQLTSIEGFQQAIRSLSPGSVVQASVLRFNAATGKFEERVANLSTFPYPTSITGLSKTTVKVEPVSFSLSEKAKQTKCVLGPCTWCCARCTSNYGGQCTRSECETGVMSCFLQNGWCRGVFCV